MRLKKIRLAGFKSFVDPTTIPFPDDMTAIVGPNGCGKSNVIDAVRWVLGESSAKNLRGDAMIDVIFNGSSSRKPVSQCSVELVFDNSSQRIQGEFAAFNEISVKRVVTRDAQSTYLLNGAKCRRKDVTELFLGTGLGPRSYAIIEQGMISRLIESKPQELRLFIEEAAGISKYKERRRETENRIKHTRENLERLGDVRSELGQQLDKLQRQAAAAKRYKELKADERRLKGELAAIRWLHMSEAVVELDNKIKQQENDIESYISKQRGDEKEMTELREQLADLKQDISDKQHEFYLVGNEITKLEQSKQYAKQREQQITAESEKLDSQHEELQQQHAIFSEQTEQLEEQLEELVPEQDMLEEQLLEAEEQLQQIQEQWQQKQQQWRTQEQRFSDLKQQAQNKHGEIQTLLQVQLRTEQRIRELQESDSADELSQWQDELQELGGQQAQLAEDIAEQQAKLEDAEQRHTHLKKELEQASSELQQHQRDWHQSEAQMHSLQQWLLQTTEVDEEVTEWLTQHGISATTILASLEVDPDWQLAVETAMQHWQNTLLVDELNEEIPEGLSLFLEQRMETYKPENTLASKCRNDRVPEWLARVEIAESLEQAFHKRQSLPAGFSIITKQGVWLGEDWMVHGLQKGQESVLQKRQQLSDLTVLCEQQSETLEQDKLKVEALETKQQDLANQSNDIAKFKQEYVLEQQHIEKRLQYAQSQLDRVKQTQAKNLADLAAQKEQLEQEKMQMEEASMAVEEIEAQILDMQDQYDDFDAEKEQFEEKVNGSRQQIDALKNRRHEFALQSQQLKTQYQHAKDNSERIQKQIVHSEERKQELIAELLNLQKPGQDQQLQLADLLEKQETLRNQQNTLNGQISQVESALAEAEKDQAGVSQKVEQMRAQVQSLALERERDQTKANGFVEQLKDMQQSLKTLLEGLPAEHDEQKWQADLDKATAGLSRLGAVNLAAVEEFEVQSERKQHLDTQNEDLEAALETLENAIRKIDKETKSRFRDTFDKVNADVKMLFPKVFGGGAAYLELTGDDLLETGVTIMARPPGKKNSTIHLLSGGEKALTALSLVFAIFRLNPAPFCLLDEVDAPLDDANVGRFCKLVEEMSKTVQFIFITHNKIAMEMAFHLTGVTMAEAGVSRIVAVDVEEAVAIANA